MRRSLCKAAVLGFAAFFVPGAAAGITIDSAIVDSVGDTFTVEFGGNIEGSDVPGLTSSATFEVEAITSNQIVLAITLENTTGDPWESARISALGFDTDIDVSSATLVSSVFGTVTTAPSGVSITVVRSAMRVTVPDSPSTPI